MANELMKYEESNELYAAQWAKDHGMTVIEESSR